MIDPSTLGAEAAAITARIESSAGLLLSAQSRAVIHDAVLELLVRCANAEAEDRPTLRWESNGEAGDHSAFCSVCSLELSEPHTWERCARTAMARRDAVEDAARMFEAERDAAEKEATELQEHAAKLTKLATAVVEKRGSLTLGRAMDALAAYLRGPGDEGEPKS